MDYKDYDYDIVYLFKKGDQFPCIVGLSVCQYFFSLVVLTPNDVLSLDTCSLTSCWVLKPHDCYHSLCVGMGRGRE